MRRGARETEEKTKRSPGCLPTPSQLGKTHIFRKQVFRELVAHRDGLMRFGLLLRVVL
jgi:hypothetical protein